MTTPFRGNTYPYNENYFLSIERQLGEDGRVLVRYSGTESKARVMIEGMDETRIQGCNDRADAPQPTNLSRDRSLRSDGIPCSRAGGKFPGRYSAYRQGSPCFEG